ncbi:MAG: hypothetical protein JXQ90_13460 [Cyclobacteriaceae bacterium]
MKLLVGLMLITLIGFAEAQSINEDSSSFQNPPKLSVLVDMINFGGNYPAALLAFEYQPSARWAIHQEFGPNLVAEANSSKRFQKYLGFKLRTELKYLIPSRRYTNVRYFIGGDFFYQNDQYIDAYEVNEGAYRRLKNGRFVRNIIGINARFGVDFVMLNNKMIVSPSFGLGGGETTIIGPEANVIPTTNIDTTDPFGNIRFKIGYVIR